MTDLVAIPSDVASPHHYFVDESGDGVIFDSRGRVLIGTGNVQDHFILGMVEFADFAAVGKELHELRAALLADPYFKGVPSMQLDGGKTALFYHAKDDLPEVRREVFKVLLRHEFNFYGIVRTMSAVHRAQPARSHVSLCAERTLRQRGAAPL